MPIPPMYKPPWYVALCALMTCIMGIFYLISIHVEGAPDQIFHDAFVAFITLTTGSIAVARAMSNYNGNGK